MNTQIYSGELTQEEIDSIGGKMNTRYDELDKEYQELQKQFKVAQKNKCTKCIQAIIKRMTEIDAEQARMLQQPLNSRLELQLQARG